MLYSGMHGAVFICFGAGQMKNFSGWGRAGQVQNPRGGATVKLGAFLGRGSLETFGAGVVWGSYVY